MRLRYFLLALLFSVSFISCRQVRVHEHADWAKLYEAHGIKNACIIIRNNNHESVDYYNKERCLQRFLPASSFKIFNSLVALETAVAPDETLTIPWDSLRMDREICNKDMTMRDAFRNSCINYYREIARRIGRERMQHYLDSVKYGNMQIGSALDSFWVNNTLQISADEQLGFIKKLYFNELPFSERTQRIVRSMMLWEDEPGYKLSYKTGTGEVDGKYVYWIVGFAERIDKNVKEMDGSLNKSNERIYPYFFAQNFEMPVADTSRDWFKARVDVLHEVLKEAGALPK